MRLSSFLASEEEMAYSKRSGRSQEVLERVNKLEAEISQLEEARNYQTLTEGQEQDATRRELVRAIDGRLKALQPELRIAVAHAAAEGFSQFGAYHLRDACSEIFSSEKNGGMSGFGQSNQNRSGNAEEFETTSHRELSVDSDSDTDAQGNMGPMLKKQNSISSSYGKFQGQSCSLAFACDDGEVIDNYNDMHTDSHTEWGKVDVNGKSRIETINPENAESRSHNSRKMGIEDTINLFENKQKDTRYDIENMIWSRDSDMSMDFADEWIETKLSKENNNKLDSGFLEYSTNLVSNCPEIPGLADSNMQLVKEMAESRKSRQFVGHGHRGKYFELYSQKREAKLREEYPLKKSENEAKFNAMDIFLQQSKRQLLELRNRHIPIALYLGKEAEEEANTDTNELNMNKQQIRKVTFSTLPPPPPPPPSSCMNVDLMSPPTKSSFSIPMPSPLTSSNFICSNKRKNPPSMPKNQLARSVPNFRDLRKENTKPSTARSGALGLGSLTSTTAHQKPKPQPGSSTPNDPLKTKAKRKSAIQSTSSSPVKVDSPWSADNSMEKKWRNKQMMKSCASVSELRNLSGGMLLNPPKISKVSGNINNPGESKTFLRKGRAGIGATARTKVL